MKVNIGDEIRIKATVVDCNKETMKLKIKGLQEDNYTPVERYIRMRYADYEKNNICKIGDTLYRVNIGAKEPIIKMRILQMVVEQAYMQKTFVRIGTINENDMGENSFLLEEIGKTVFLSRSEAEAKLEELRGNNGKSEKKAHKDA